MPTHSLHGRMQRSLRNATWLLFPLPNSFSGQNVMLRICNSKFNHYLEKKKDDSFSSSVSNRWYQHEICINTQITIKENKNFGTVTTVIDNKTCVSAMWKEMHVYEHRRRKSKTRINSMACVNSKGHSQETTPRTTFPVVNLRNGLFISRQAAFW